MHSVRVVVTRPWQYTTVSSIYIVALHVCVSGVVWRFKSPVTIWLLINLTFIDPCIANPFAEYNQQDASFHNLFISVRRSTCFRRFFCPSSTAQNCTYSVRHLSDQYLKLYVQFWAPDDGRKNRLKHAERLTEINKLRNVASCW